MNVTPFLTRATIALLATQRHNWEHGTAMQAFLEAGRMDLVIPMAREAVYRQLPDGRPAGMEPLDGVVDPCACGEGILRAWQETGDKTLEKGLQALNNGCGKKRPVMPRAFCTIWKPAASSGRIPLICCRRF